MKLQIDIATPNALHMDVNWTEGVPIPSIGDHFMWRRQQITWSFNVIERVIGVGTDIVNGGLMTHISLKVDLEAPEGFQTHFQNPQASR